MTCRIEVAFTEMKTSHAVVPMMSCVKRKVEFPSVEESPPCTDLVSVFVTSLTNTNTHVCSTAYSAAGQTHVVMHVDACSNN